MTVFDRINERLAVTGLSARAASAAAGLGESYIRDLGRKADSPRVQGLEKLAPVLKTTVEWLRTGIGDPNQTDDPATAEVVSIMPRLKPDDRQNVADYAKFLESKEKPKAEKK